MPWLNRQVAPTGKVYYDLLLTDPSGAFPDYRVTKKFATDPTAAQLDAAAETELDVAVAQLIAIEEENTFSVMVSREETPKRKIYYTLVLSPDERAELG